MSKRYSETARWDAPWYRRMTPDHKTFLEFLYSMCDNAGVWEIDWENASFKVNASIGPEVLAVLNENQQRVKLDETGRYLLVLGHIQFQCGNLLQPKLTNLQKSAIRLMYKHITAFRFSQEDFGFTGKLPVDDGYKYKEDKEDKEDKNDSQYKFSLERNWEDPKALSDLKQEVASLRNIGWRDLRIKEHMIMRTIPEAVVDKFMGREF